MKNHAFIILAHKQPALLARTIRALERDNHFFFINVDKKTRDFEGFESSLGGCRNVFFFRESVYHCGISHLYCLLKIIKQARQNKPEIDFYHIISGQDYPLRSSECFDDFFENNERSYMYFDNEEYLRSMKNIFVRMSQDWHLNRTGGRLRRVYNILKMPRLLGLVFRRKDNPDYYNNSGWDWFSWNKKVVDYVFRYLDKNPDYIKRYNHTVTPTEHIFHAILGPVCNELQIEKMEPLRFVSWNPQRPVKTSYRPYNLTHEDYDKVINSRAFFCRKVDEQESSKLLDMIDSQRMTPYNLKEHTDFI